jgi:hypothetical protein
MSAAPARNWASMLKEKKAAAPAKAVVSVPAAAAPAETTAVAEAAAMSLEPPRKKVVVPAQQSAEHVLTSVSVGTPMAEAATPAAVSYTTLGPISLPEALAKLVQPSEFRFAGAVTAPQPTPTTLPAPVAAAPAVTSSLEIPVQQQQPWTAPQPVYNPLMNYFVPQHSVARPYGGELGSVPRYYNAERQHHAQPYHPTYQTPYYNYRGGYGGAAYNPYQNMYPNYYPGQGAPYMSGCLQAQQPYYPPRNYQHQQ